MKSTVASLVVLLFLTSTASAQQEHLKTTQETHEGANVEYKKVDDELNWVYNQVLQKYNSDSVFVEKLILAQRAWIKSRDADMFMVYPYKDIGQQEYYGSIFPVCYLINLTEMTKQRTAFLRKWIDTIDDGVNGIDVCNGSIIVKKVK